MSVNAINPILSVILRLRTQVPDWVIDSHVKSAFIKLVGLKNKDIFSKSDRALGNGNSQQEQEIYNV